MLLVEPYGPSVRLAFEKLGAQPSLQLVECSSALDAASLARRLSCALIVCYAAKEDDATRHMTMLKLLKAQIKRQQVRFLFVSSIRDSFLNRRISQDFDSEVLLEPVSEKSLLFKVERLTRQLAKVRTEEVSGGITQESETSFSPESVELFRMVPALELESDCWLQIPGEIKRVGGRWIIKMQGPPSKNGRWVAIDSNDSSTDAWQWMPVNPESDIFIKEEGAWVFLGQKPEFQGNGWLFVSRKPQLSFFYDGQSYGSKFALEGNVLLVTKNSQAAVTAHSLLSLNQEVPEPKQSGGRSIGLSAQLKDTPEGEREEDGAFSLTEPLAIESDCWLLQGRRPRRLAHKWSISLLGPGPESGRWVAIEAEGESSADSYWQWLPTDPANDPFITEEGSWVFRGAMPKHRDDLWVFVGEKPELSFYYEGTSYGAKILTGIGNALLLAKDSGRAAQLAQLFEVRMHKVIAQKEREAEAAEDAATGSADATAFYKYALDHFGQVGGEWEAATTGSQQRRWYVYIPVEVLTAESVDIRRLTAYWLYFGSLPPKIDGAEWKFADRRPQAYKNFGDVPRPIQAFLTEFFSSQKESGPATDAVAGAVEAGGNRRVFEAETFGVPGGDWEAVGVGSQMRRWYVYVPMEVLQGIAGDIRRLPIYWTYFGATAPAKESAPDGVNFVFETRDPQSHQHFRDLPREAQEFFVQFFSEQAGAALPAEDRQSLMAAPELAPPESASPGPKSPAASTKEVFRPVLKTAGEVASGEAREEPASPGHAVPRPVTGGGAGKGREFAAEDRDLSLVSKPRQSPAAQEQTGTAKSQPIAALPSKSRTQAKPLPTFAARPRRESDGTVSYLYKVEDIGAAGGEWEPVGTTPDGRKVFTYIPVELLHNVAEDVRKLNLYWVYQGPSKPKLVTQDGRKYWSFAAREPLPFVEFEALETSIQRFLSGYFERKFASLLETSETGVEGAELPDYIERGDDTQGGTYLNYSGAREREPDPVFKTFSEPALSDASKNFKVEMPVGQGPKVIRAPRPPGPSLSPLAVAFLLSELICKQDLDRSRIGQKYCEYLGASFGGLRVELWVNAGGTWFCAGASDAAEGVEPQYGNSFDAGADLSPGFKSSGVFLAPLKLDPSAALPVGALAIGGPGAELVPLDYALSVIKMARGVLLTLSGEDRVLFGNKTAA